MSAHDDNTKWYCTLGATAFILHHGQMPWKLGPYIALRQLSQKTNPEIDLLQTIFAHVVKPWWQPLNDIARMCKLAKNNKLWPNATKAQGLHCTHPAFREHRPNSVSSVCFKRAEPNQTGYKGCNQVYSYGIAVKGTIRITQRFSAGIQLGNDPKG